MDSLLITFILACSSTLLWHQLPPISSLLIILVTVIALGSRRLFSRYVGVTLNLIAATLGIIWMGSVGHWYTHWQLPHHYYQQTLTVQGTIETLEEPESISQFVLRADAIGKQSFHVLKPRIRLSWFDSPWSLKQGQEVRLVAKLKAPRGRANKHGFKLEPWLLSQGIQATGYVILHADNQWLNKEQTLRQTVLTRISNYSLQNEAWILALSLGFRDQLSPDDWHLLQRTGTAHLIAISGLHVGMIAIAGYFLASIFIYPFLAISGLHDRISLHRIALYGGWFAALGYAWLAGFSVSTLRALVMLTLVLAAHQFGWHWSFRRIVLMSMALMFVISPLSVLSIGFWLSFSAVSFIGFLLWRYGRNDQKRSWWAKCKLAIQMQLMLSALMLPLVAWQMQIVSFSSSFANVIAIPLMSFFLLPLTLLATCLTLFDASIVTWLFEGLDASFTALIVFLQWVNDIEWGAITINAISSISWLLAFGMIIILALPALPISKKITPILLLPLLSEVLHDQRHSWQLDVFDVGQGLSVLLSQQGKHRSQAILYDTGAAFDSGFSMAESVLLPYFRGENLSTLDALIISHKDNDHAGGQKVILAAQHVHEFIDSDSSCVAGKQWQFSGARFTALWPTNEARQASQAWSENDLSCVIKADFGLWSVLLPGDIEAQAERALLALYQKQPDVLQADVLLAPHHGSKTSSTEGFIQAVAPNVVIFSQGYKNRWNMPHQDVLQRYQKHSITTLQTSSLGQIRVTFYDGINIESYRNDWAPYWYFSK
ncbi:DNA internalization-related competence protein ComEC/Rec2 [Alteromonas sp. a30]|uniref:DNA internalization-related competence protein ComEC/Rec2 n=1 Tax=Alteromonas sp. a30 TaxID=2730917 RepID=UPI0022827E55|nr:DNA internalization-related competence protein ComEC/Rec2 [Alteromonas sp. a30]MCY7293943.1 DNA internalization-related competence protein ComEC/Rec2 [Alteromonas sp. a30]